MADRRNFLKVSALSSLAAGPLLAAAGEATPAPPVDPPVAISTWNHGLPANEAAWEILGTGGAALDAVEAGVRVPEGDPSSRTVGYGGRPDRSGDVTLDACIMGPGGDAGSVAYLQHVKHPVSVARRVMTETPHVMLVGEGALAFALRQGFEKEDLLTEASQEEWRAWLEEQPDRVKAQINVENEPQGDAPRGNRKNHDTIGMLALDESGELAGACTTSGAAWKVPGRVGDSPIIGAGLFVDDAVGAACATGWGEAVIRVVGSHLVVELMRQGRSPQAACREATERIIEKNPEAEDIQVGFLALGKDGRHGAYSIQPGFNFALRDAPGGNRLIDAESKIS
jgi:L-asparaginase/N4-(beta-N-acetylglucosaminyl)-L-asparaginase